MNNSSVNTLLESHAFVSGAAFLSSSLDCCSIGKYMRLEGVAFHLQLKGIAIATAAQTVFRSLLCKGFETETEQDVKKECLVLRSNKDCNTWKKEVLSILSPIALAGLLVKRSDFKSPVLMTATIAGGYFFAHKQLSYNIPLAICSRDFKDALLENSVPNRPTTIINDRDVDLQDSGITWLPDELHIEGNLNLKGCIALRAIPERLYLGGNLNLEGCRSLTELPRDLDIKGDLTLNGCTNLATLPRGLKVAGNLNFEGCSMIRSLPADMDVKGNINAKGCTNLSIIPEGFVTRGRLGLENCMNIRTLPHGLKVEKHMNLSNCSGLLSIPEDLLVGGTLNLRGCIGLKELPDQLNPSDGFCLDGCTEITKLHKNHFINGISIRGCTGIKELPEEIYVSDGLYINNIREIHLPDGLKADGDLELKNIEVCSLPRGLKEVGGKLLLNKLNITELPEGLKRLGGLGISHCPHLKTLPEDLVVEGDVFIGGGTPELKVLPKGLRVKGDLVIRKESSVTELSENLHVDGDLKAEETSIEKLGENTHVGGKLDLDKTKIENLPDQMTVCGDIILNDCYRLTRIPDWMKRLPPRADGKERTICLNGILIPIEELEYLRQAYPGRSDIGIYYARQRLDMGNSFLRRDENPFDAHREQLELLEIAHIERPTEEQIRKAFKSLSLRNHPDKGGSKEKQQQLEAARNELLKVIESHGL